MSDSAQVQSGVKWISVSMMVTRISRLLTTLVLARLLAPEMFGIIGMAYVTLEILQKIREMGFGQAYIQRQETDPDRERVAANTTFWMGAGINILLFVSAVLAAPAIGAFFRSEAAVPVLQVLCISFLIDILISVPSLDLQKRLDFRNLTLCEVAQSVSYAVIAIVLALSGFGVWSLVWGQLASKFVFMGALLMASPWRPRLEFCPQIARELFKFGKYIWAFVVLSGIGDALDKLVVGRYYGETQLGLYSMAFLLATLPSTNITALINRLTFPLFSRMQANRAELRAALGKALAHVSVLAIPASLGIAAVAPLFVGVVLQEKWAPMIPLVGVLCYYGLILSVAAVTGPALNAIGKPKVLFYTSIIHHATKIALLIALQGYGVIGICYAVLIPMVISSGMAFILVMRYLKYPFWELMMPVVRPTIAAVVMFAGVQVLVQFSSQVEGVVLHAILLIASVIIGAVLYLGVSYYINRPVLAEIAQALQGMAGLSRARNANATTG